MTVTRVFDYPAEVAGRRGTNVQTAANIGRAVRQVAEQCTWDRSLVVCATSPLWLSRGEVIGRCYSAPSGFFGLFPSGFAGTLVALYPGAGTSRVLPSLTSVRTQAPNQNRSQLRLKHRRHRRLRCTSPLKMPSGFLQVFPYREQINRSNCFS